MDYPIEHQPYSTFICNTLGLTIRSTCANPESVRKRALLKDKSVELYTAVFSFIAPAVDKVQL
jgi:hypothetical protein